MDIPCGKYQTLYNRKFDNLHTEYTIYKQIFLKNGMCSAKEIAKNDTNARKVCHHTPGPPITMSFEIVIVVHY